MKCGADHAALTLAIREIERLQPNKHPAPTMDELKHSMRIEAAKSTRLGYCPDCGISRIPPFLKRCSRCCDTEEKQTEQAWICEENSDFYPTKISEEK